MSSCMWKIVDISSLGECYAALSHSMGRSLERCVCLASCISETLPYSGLVAVIEWGELRIPTFIYLCIYLQ